MVFVEATDVKRRLSYEARPRADAVPPQTDLVRTPRALRRHLNFINLMLDIVPAPDILPHCIITHVTALRGFAACVMRNTAAIQTLLFCPQNN